MLQKNLSWTRRLSSWTYYGLSGKTPEEPLGKNGVSLKCPKTNTERIGRSQFLYLIGWASSNQDSYEGPEITRLLEVIGVVLALLFRCRGTARRRDVPKGLHRVVSYGAPQPIAEWDGLF